MELGLVHLRYLLNDGRFSNDRVRARVGERLVPVANNRVALLAGQSFKVVSLQRDSVVIE